MKQRGYYILYYYYFYTINLKQLIMKSRLKFFAKLIIALVLVVPLFVYLTGLVLSILALIIVAIVVTRLLGGKVNLTVNTVNK